MPSVTYDTPEEAAMSGFPAQACTVVAAAREGDDAYVLIDTGPSGHPYLYGVCVAREGRGWAEGSSGNAPGWTLTGGDEDVGTLTEWGEAPSNATRVRVAWNSETREAPVARGAYLVAWWRVPYSEDSPRVKAFLVGGRWIPAG